MPLSWQIKQYKACQKKHNWVQKSQSNRDCPWWPAEAATEVFKRVKDKVAQKPYFKYPNQSKETFHWQSDPNQARKRLSNQRKKSKSITQWNFLSNKCHEKDLLTLDHRELQRLTLFSLQKWFFISKVSTSLQKWFTFRSQKLSARWKKISRRRKKRLRACLQWCFPKAVLKSRVCKSQWTETHKA